MPSPIDEDGEEVPACETEPYEDESSRSACVDCGKQFAINADSARGDRSIVAAEEDADGVETILEEMTNVA